MILAPVDEIAELFGSAAAEDYLGEPVTVLAHLLPAGALAETAGAPPALVAAKRYLCAVEPSYVALLSRASIYTLSVPGGPMTEAEAGEFEALTYAKDAVAVRGWDDQAKDPAADVPGFDRYRPLLEQLVSA